MGLWDAQATPTNRHRPIIHIFIIKQGEKYDRPKQGPGNQSKQATEGQRSRALVRIADSQTQTHY
jgi:hypothetical protein